jgi:O-antigen biosynthesis protein
VDQTSELDIYARGAWLFDQEFYLARYHDLTPERLAEAGFASALDHFRRAGDQARRSPSLFFDPAFYLAQLPEAEAAEAAPAPFRHFVAAIEAGETERQTSPYFDPAAYHARYHVPPGTGALYNYFANDTPTEFDPLPEFSERYYIARYPDIAAAVESGKLRCGYRHFVTHGVFEQRRPSRDLDLAWYVANNPQVAQDLKVGHARDAFAHFLTIGRKLGFPTKPFDELPSEAHAATLWRVRAEARLPAIVRKGLDFTLAGPPAVSVIIITRDRFPYLLSTLASLLPSAPSNGGGIELILIDLGSTDETSMIERFVIGAQVMRFDPTADALRLRNAAIACASASAILLLHDTAELAPVVLNRALSRLTSDPSVGAVCGAILRPDGVLLEAGATIDPDGTIRPRFAAQRPTAPEAHFVTNVDACSPTFLLLRTDLLNELGGFDETLCDGGGETEDLCLRISAAGKRVICDPSITIQLMIPPEPSPRGDLARLRGRHAQVLTRPRLHGEGRILYIDDTIPVRMIGSGFVRSNDLIRTMRRLGFHVTVFSLAPPRAGPGTIACEIPDDVELAETCGLSELPGFLAQRAHGFDIVWIARTHNLDAVRPALQKFFARLPRKPLVILDTEAIASTRNAVRALLLKEPFNVGAEVRQEFRNATFCERVVAVSGTEAETLRALGLPNVHVIGHSLAPAPTETPFSERNGMLFIGAIHEQGSPNYDALSWFVEEVLPLVDQQLTWETRLSIAGYTGPGIDLSRWQRHPRITLLGPVADPAALYASHHIFVAPTRFAAGLPYKLHEAAALGLPAVTTTLLAGQLGWTSGQHLLAASCAEPAEFAAHVVRLYRDGSLWHRLRDAALDRLSQDASPERFEAALSGVLRTGIQIDREAAEA